MNLIEIAKEARKIVEKNLNATDINLDICKKIYYYIQNIDNLNEKEIADLDAIIKENSVETVHLADIYIIGSRKTALKKRLNRIKPFKVSKLDSRVYEARGDILKLANTNRKREIRVKKITYAKNA